MAVVTYPEKTRIEWADAENRAPSVNSFGRTRPIYIAHRGGSLRYPEETYEGYRASYVAGNRVLEMDAQALSDGALGVMHDTTVDAMTTGTGNVSSFSTATWEALAIDANTRFGGSFGNALVPPLLHKLIAEYNGKAILVIEAKSAGTGAAIVAALVAAGVSTDKAIVQSFNLSDLADAVAAGYPAMYLTTVSTGIAAAQAAGITWVGIGSTALDADVTAWNNAGVKTVVYTVSKQFERDRFLALGVSGFFSDDPEYLSLTTPYATSDQYAAQRWMPGMIALNLSLLPAFRGQFVAPDYFVLPLDSTTFTSVLQGWASPLKSTSTPLTVSIDFKVKFSASAGGDVTRWASVFIGKSDRSFTDGAAATADEQGFNFLLRKAGQLQIYKRSTSAAAQITNVSTVAIADDEEVAYRIAMTPTAVTLYRLNGSGDIAYTATTADSDTAFRGAYLHFCRAGVGASFRDVLIT